MPETMRMFSHEKQFIMQLFALSDAIHKDQQSVEERLKAQDNVSWRNLRCIDTMLNKVIKTITDSMIPADQVWAQRFRDHARISIGAAGNPLDKSYAIVDIQDLTQLVLAAGCNKCPMCIRTGKEIERCKLRPAIARVCAYNGEPDHYLCPFALKKWDDDEL